MALNAPSNSVKRISYIIEERDKVIVEKDARIKYFKTALSKKSQEIQELEKTFKYKEEEDKTLSKQIQQLQFINKFLAENKKVTIQSLINHQTFEKILIKELNQKEKETQHVQKELNNTFQEKKARLIVQNPLYQKLQEKKVTFLKMNIERKLLAKKIRERKKIITQKAELKKRLFYARTIALAEFYLVCQRTVEVQQLRLEEQKTIRRMNIIKKDIKLREKLGTSNDKAMKTTNICFGSQDLTLEQENKTSELVRTPPGMKGSFFNDKLCDMFESNESSKENILPKVKILHQVALVPAFPDTTFAVPVKQRRTIDLSRKWQQFMRNGSFSKEGIKSHNSSFQQVCEKSQTSQMSQPSQVLYSSQRSQPSQQSLNQPTEEPLNQPRENQPTQNAFSSNALTYYNQNNIQMENNINVDDINAQNSMTGNRNIVKNVQQNPPAVQVPIIENMEVEPQMIYENLQESSCVAQEQNMHGGGIVRAKQGLTPNMQPKPPYAKPEKAPKMNFVEPSKSVRFNLESVSQHKDTKEMFGPQSFFPSTFSSFFNRPAMKNPQMETSIPEQPLDHNSSFFNVSMMDTMGNSHMEAEYEPVSSVKSPEFSYDMESEIGAQNASTAPEMPNFGGGGFFSFQTKNMFSPF